MRNVYTFNKATRYMTRGIKERIPLCIQLILWGYIDEIVDSEFQTDYLQVFNLSIEEETCKLVHTQEKANYQKIYRYPLSEEIKNLDDIKIYVIDDLTHSTMLLASEY